ncbi:MAG: hypothetical protein AAGF12_04690 [Myxococcota bacterium]
MPSRFAVYFGVHLLALASALGVMLLLDALLPLGPRDRWVLLGSGGATTASLVGVALVGALRASDREGQAVINFMLGGWLGCPLALSMVSVALSDDPLELPGHLVSAIFSGLCLSIFVAVPICGLLVILFLGVIRRLGPILDGTIVAVRPAVERAVGQALLRPSLVVLVVGCLGPADAALPWWCAVVFAGVPVFLLLHAELGLRHLRAIARDPRKFGYARLPGSRFSDLSRLPRLTEEVSLHAAAVLVETREYAGEGPFRQTWNVRPLARID